MELYKKYRPTDFEAVLGNEQTVAALKNMLARKTLPHVILFHGPSGCGKTTLARILKGALGCHQLDYYEMNSGSFRGIETVRDVARSMSLSPTAGPCRVWVFDEVHKWTNDAQNAALKILEDTPSHVFFFHCTTDPQKLVKALQGRCCEMPIRSLTYDELTSLAKKVARREKIDLSRDVLDELVGGARGSARNLLVLLDKISNLSRDEQLAAIQQRVGEEAEGIELCRLLLKKDRWPRIAQVLKNLKVDPETIRWAVLGYARSVLLGSNKPDYQAYVVIDVFSKPFFDSKEAGLAAACYEAIQDE